MRERFPQLSESINERYEIYNYRHALSILTYDFTSEFSELKELLESFYITEEEILTPGGRKSPIAEKFDSHLYNAGWKEKNWDINIEIDGEKKHSPTHSVDYFKNGIAVELEWNNKDPFFDRDLNNFRVLHGLGTISVGIIVTRSSDLQAMFNTLNKGKSYGASTTHIGKLLPKINGGGAAQCPLLIIGMTSKCIQPLWGEGINQ